MPVPEPGAGTLPRLFGVEKGMRMKRLTIVLAVLAAVLIASGCGNSGSGNATEDALSFMPKDAPVVITLDTDPDGDQWKQVNKLVSKFPFAGQIKSQVKNGFNQSSKLDFDKDLKPILGNELVFVVPTVAGLQADDTPVFGALHVDDEGKAKDFVEKDANKATTIDGTDVYKEQSDTYIAVKDGTILIGDTTNDIGAALKRQDGDDHMTQDDLDARLAGVQGDGLVKIGVNAQQAIAGSPDSAQARKVKWVNGLRDVGTVISVQDDGIQESFKANTEGVSEADLPLAPGAAAAPVVRRAADVGLGMRDLSQLVAFSQTASQLTNPKGYADFQRRKRAANKTLGIDIDKDVIGQLKGDASLSFGIDGGFAVRSDLSDPAAFRKTLRKAAPKLDKLAKSEHVGIAVPKNPNGFYALATAKGKKYVFAVRGGKFVLATDPARAAQFSGQSSAPVPGAKGSLTMAMDTRAIANQVAAKQGQNGAQLITGSLGDFVGWVQTETSGMTGTFKLNVK
jgi:Protein of unknown function (DUF3352)